MQKFPKDQLENKLIRLGQELEKLKVRVKLVLLGSVPNILRGQPDRYTEDFDIWNPESEYDRSMLAAAAAKAGIAFDPKKITGSEQAYLQIVDPGIVQLGTFVAEKVATYGYLQIFQPPVENLIASKLCRAAPQDISDIAWLLDHYRPDSEIIAEVIKSFPRQQRETATENMIYLRSIEADRPQREKRTKAFLKSAAKAHTEKKSRNKSLKKKRDA